MASLTSHAESTSSTLLYALLPLVSPPNSSISHDIHHAASHLGISQTIVTLLRALPYHLTTARNKTLVIPSEITAKHGVNQELILRGNAPEEQRERLQEAVYEFACAANDQLLTAREMWEKIGRPKDVMPIFLPAVRCVEALYFCTELINLYPGGRVILPDALGESQLQYFPSGRAIEKLEVAMADIHFVLEEKILTKLVWRGSDT